MKTSNRDTILNKIRTGSVSASSLSMDLNVPTPSVRRLVSELRAEGWRIVTNYFGYRLQTPERV